MDKQKNVVFRSAPGGYNKRDVNAFIASLNDRFSAAEEEYRQQLASLRTENHQLKQNAERTAELETEVNRLREQLAALQAEQQEASVCASVLAEEEAAELRKKAELYDRMSSQIGDVMISANHTADQLLADTRRDAELTLGAAKQTIAQSASLLSSRLEELYRTANTRAIGEITASMHQSQRAMTKFMDDLSARRAQLEEMLRQADAETRRTADEYIEKMIESAQDAVDAIGKVQGSANA